MTTHLLCLVETSASKRNSFVIGKKLQCQALSEWEKHFTDHRNTEASRGWGLQFFDTSVKRKMSYTWIIIYASLLLFM